MKDCLPTVLGYLSIGFAAGVVEKTAGLSLFEIALMSLLLYAGSAQFIAAGMLVSGAPIMSIILTIFIVNLRYLLLSAALAPHFRHLGAWKNTVHGFLLTDETFGVAASYLSDKKYASNNWMLGLNLTAYLNWTLANVLGGLLGKWIPHPEAFGLDFALPAMFIGLVVLQVIARSKLRMDLLVAAGAVLFTVCASFIVPTGIDVILATVVAAALGVVIERWK
ncbi:AzlC family ABC transporter permease [Heyndrickxia sp. NPDC080065]|uniref:AzlC family ABC transporter permease n=1 Tax=Heyndrickxia sp. NPDC080065 TaxID=3390568 RepID=UPI003D02DC7C